MHIADPETTNNSAFINCQIKDLAYATSSPKLIATPSASSGTAANANDGNDATAWTPTSSTNQWIQLDFATPTTVNEFRIKETAGSSVTRYAIECWDDKQALWVSCFNGRTIGSNYVAPIVSRTTQKARLWITSTGSGNPVIAEFQAYNDLAGQTFSTLRDPVTINVDPPTGVTQSATTTTLSSSPNPAGVGQAVTLAASVSSAAGTPTGTVNFNEGAALLGTGILNGNGVATFSTSALAAGTHTITATYVGSHYCLTSTSTSISQGVNP